MKPENRNNRVYPAEAANNLDSFIRKLFQNPRKIMKPHIHNGMTILDLGCGPGFFTIEIAKMLNGSGKVIAADLQEEMLEKVRTKIRGTSLEERIELNKCEADTTGITTPVDFVLAFYVIHEIRDHSRLFAELRSILRSGGKIHITEPAHHVSAAEFEKMVSKLENNGFEIISRPKILVSRSVLAKAV